MATGSGAAAAVMAKKGVGMLFSATRSSVTALSRSISKARKGYANKHESTVLEEIRQSGISPGELVFQALRRVYFLYMAGYKHELAAAALETGRRLVEPERSSVPLEAVLAFGHSVAEEALKYGFPAKGRFAQEVQDFVNKSRMGKDHYDRTSVSHDFYYAILTAVQVYGAEWNDLERLFREAASRVIGNAIHATEETKDARAKAAKALHIFAKQIEMVAQDAEMKRQKAVRDAENLLRKEQERQRKLSSSAAPVSY